MADLLRNEVEIELAGQTRTMRASFSAIRAIEKELGKSLVRLINDIGASGDFSVTDAVTIIHHGLRGYNDTRLTLDQIGDAVVVEGFQSKATAAAEFLKVALMGASLGKPQDAA
ncbi:MAG: gene transfer agent family protein [Aquamicrobium sp.]|nr:gene transfer agent family protein [Aquamicrobium sp.]